MNSNSSQDRRLFANRLFSIVQEYIDAETPAEHVLEINPEKLTATWLPREKTNNLDVYELDELIYADESGIIEPDDDAINHIVNQYFE